MTQRRADLARRVEQVFMEMTGAETPRGARAWIADLARITPVSVSRILAGDQPADRIEAALDAIEAGRRFARIEFLTEED